MRFKLHRNPQTSPGKSLFGILSGVDVRFRAHSCERGWRNNESGKSCVPDGFYVLEPHNGNKYKDTYALIGQYVSHTYEKLSGVPRYACVFHWSSRGSGLQGCVSLGAYIGWPIDDTPVLGNPLLAPFMRLLKSNPGPHYLTITSEGDHSAL